MPKPYQRIIRQRMQVSDSSRQRNRRLAPFTFAKKEFPHNSKVANTLLQLRRKMQVLKFAIPVIGTPFDPLQECTGRHFAKWSASHKKHDTCN